MPDGVDVLKLHPWTLLQRLVVSLPGFVILLIPIIRNPSGAGLFNLGIAALYGAITLPLIYLQYHRFRYWITPSELVIHSGVLTRRRRNIPVEKIQNIEIQRKLLPRLLGTASVKVFTAGSATAEGVLEYVSAGEADRIREVIRSFQRQKKAGEKGGFTGALTVSDELPMQEDAGRTLQPSLPSARVGQVVPPLVSMPLNRVLLSGVFRFSLLYIAIIFSFLQFIEPDPEQLASMVMRGRLRLITDAVAGSPWAAGAILAATAAVLSWLSGIAVNLNNYYGFTLWRDKDKLHKRHGLLTLSEATIPLKKVQTLICRSNPVMAWFGWWALELQTMGLNIRERGHQVAAPFVREEEIGILSQQIQQAAWPAKLKNVSRLTIRRKTVRYGALLILLSLVLGAVWKPALTLLGVIPLVPLWAWLQYRHHGYQVSGDTLVIRKGVIRRMVWQIPIEKVHVFYTAQSFFQRRLHLTTLYVDTAGASSMHFPTIVDIPAQTADLLTGHLYSRFRELVMASNPDDRRSGFEDSKDRDTVQRELSFALPVPASQ